MADYDDYNAGYSGGNSGGYAGQIAVIKLLRRAHIRF